MKARSLIKGVKSFLRPTQFPSLGAPSRIVHSFGIPSIKFQFTMPGPSVAEELLMPIKDYKRIAEHFLESLSEQIEILDDERIDDINYSDGILTISTIEKGIYVLNKQTPNRQIWLSSPISGPYRFDFEGDAQSGEGAWSNSRTDQELLGLLSEEFSQILQKDVKFV